MLQSKLRKTLYGSSMASSKCLLQQQAMKQPKLPQMDKVLYQRFTAMHSEGKPVTWPPVLGKVKAFMW
jgi:hypothetical protein